MNGSRNEVRTLVEKVLGEVAFGACGIQLEIHDESLKDIDVYHQIQGYSLRFKKIKSCQKIDFFFFYLLGYNYTCHVY